MDSFLHLLAGDMAREHLANLHRLTVILPNKRAGLFLARELAGLIDRPAWMPAIVTLEEFVETHAGLKRADDLALVIKLYRAYRQASGTEETFDDFYFWGNMLLEDFNDVDKYLVDARDLFSNLHALKEVERSFPYLSEEQITLIRRFWSHFRQGACSREQLSFLQTWERLHPTYLRFRQGLLDEGLCYEGMGLRLLLDHLDAVPPDDILLFAGFNALNACENKIFAHFRDNGQARFYWDHDTYYTDNPAHEAGIFLRHNLKQFPNAIPPENFDNLRRPGKRVEEIAVPSVVAQAKLLPLLLDEFAPAPRVQTAIVLCDERLLTPVIHSIPPAVEKINITMGYPARNTAAAALLALACDLRRNQRQQNNRRYYYHQPVIALLNHPFVTAGSHEEARQITQRARAENLVYIPADQLDINPVARALFNSDEADPLAHLVHVLGAALVTLSADTRQESAIEKEVLFALRARVQQTSDAFRQEGISPGERLHARLVDQVICSLAVPFSGEPLEGMQIMGLLETRLLDFKKLIILSVNEGAIPGAAPLTSFIPRNLRVGFGLPTPEHRDAIYAYHFYRLLQRADEIKLLHADSGKNGGEPSRFLQQLQYESGIPVRPRYLHHDISTRPPSPIAVHKNDDILLRLLRYTEAGRGISPSALNTLLECGLRFYFKHVAGIREKEEIVEELDHRLLGNLFHETIQTLHATLPGGLATADRLLAIAADEPLLHQHARAALAKIYNDAVARLTDSGANELALSVVKKYVKKVLEFDALSAPFTILSMERKHALALPLPGGRVVHIEGNIDRVDRLPAATRVIDYKTGSDKGDFKSIASLFDPSDRHRNKAAFQILLYCLMVKSEHPDALPLLPAIFSTKQLFAPRYDYHLTCNSAPVTDLQPFEDEFKESLARLIDDLFSPDHPFTPAADAEKCRSCPYTPLCNRE